MKKEFDCVEMKRKAQERILRQIRGKTPEQELAYWKSKSDRVVRVPGDGQKRSA